MRARPRPPMRARVEPLTAEMRRAALAPNWIERTIAHVSPAWATGRLAARLSFQATADRLRKYDAADVGRRLGTWIAPSTGPNSEVLGALARIRNRVRDLVRNNAYAARAVRGIVSRVVGTGMNPILDDGPVKDAWVEWSTSTACDAEGQDNFAGLQRTHIRSVVEAGEGVGRRIMRSAFRKQGVPLRIQLLEPDFIDETRDNWLGKDPLVVQGVKLDQDGRRVAYLMHKEHPGERGAFGFGDVQEIPASEIVHSFRRDRAGQVRGLPWGAPCVLRMKEFDDYLDAELLRKKIATAFVGFVHDISVEATDPSTGTDRDEAVEDFQPGTWEYLPDGKTITFSNPPTVEGFSDYVATTLRELAAGWGVTYEILTGDYSQVNFTSGRMGWLEFHAEVGAWQTSILVNQFCQPVWTWFLAAASLAGIDVDDAPTHPRWVGTRREMIDPVAEMKALIMQVRAGVLPLSELLLMISNQDPRDTLEQVRKDFDLLDELGLTVEADPRQPMQEDQVEPGAGGPPPKPAPAKKNGAVQLNGNGRARRIIRAGAGR